MSRRPKTRRGMPIKVCNFNVDKALHDDFERCRRKHGKFKNKTDFWNDCMKAFVFQMRRGENPAYPIEFLQAKSGKVEE